MDPVKHTAATRRCGRGGNRWDWGRKVILGTLAVPLENVTQTDGKATATLADAVVHSGLYLVGET